MAENPLLLPRNIEAERAILGSALLDPENVIPILQEKLRPEHFYQRAHRLIYRTLCELFDHGKLADVVTVANRLEEKGEIQHAGGRIYLTDLMNKVSTTTSAEHYCEIVLKKAGLRALIESGRRISELGRQEEQDTDDLQDKALSILSDTITADTGDKIMHIQEAGQSFMEKLDAVRAGRPLGTTTGYSSLDKVLYGLEGKLTVIGGYTSSGKTCLKLNMAYRQVTKGIPVGFISVEMGRDPIMERLIQMEGHLTRDNLRYGSGKKVAEAASRIYSKPLYIVEVHSNSLMAIVRQMRQLLMRHKVEVIYVDYLQKVRVPNWKGERYREVGEVTNMLQEFARVSGIGVVTGSQVSRESLQGGGPPKLQHMRECVTGDTLVALSSGGLVPIKELVGKTPEVISLRDDWQCESRRTETIWKVGVRPTIQIKLASGRHIRVTKDHLLLSGRRWARCRDLSLKDRIAIMRRGNVFWDRIIGIETGKEEEVFDLTVPGTHNWVANGIVSHNSGNIENDSDIIIGLFNPRVTDSLEKNKRIRLEVLKHREGLRGNILDFAYFDDQQRIEELTLESPRVA